MAAEVNGNFAVAQFNRARVIMYSGDDDYIVCGKIVITPDFIFMSGHGNESTGFEPVVSLVVNKYEVRFITDNSVEPCETHDKMDAEARAQMEALKNAEENKKD